MTMKTKTSLHVGSWLGYFVLWILASGIVGSLSAGTVPIRIDATNATATISVPKNAGKVLIEVQDSKNGAWKTFKNIQIKTSPATVQVALPSGFRAKSRRASVAATTLASGSSTSKYPKKFFEGKKTFQAVVASSYSAIQTNSAVSPMALGSASIVLKTTAVADTASPTSASSSTATKAVESDIWKVEGTTAYYFNQYRGLQVIDLSDPVNPSLQAYYRLPAKGQDLYILPSQGDTRHVILITHENDGSTGVNLLKVVGSKVTLLSNKRTDGWMADSRMVGNRLYLATQTWGLYYFSDCLTSLKEFVVAPTKGTLSAGKVSTVSGSWPVISAGGDWMAVATSDWNDWQTSKVTLFSLGDYGAAKSADAVALYGRLYDKDHMGYESGRFSAVSERWVSDSVTNSWWWNGTRVTTLQNFSASGTQLASLEIQRGESLYAAKFDGDKAYIVTARQVDPLFVVDLSDATNPLLAGQLEVPGRSTRIVPVSGDKLFTIGFDGSNKVCASLFGVSNPASPTLLSRVSLGGTWGYSAATYDDKALKVLPDDGLAFIPYTSFTDSWASQQYVQILKLNADAGSLSLGGAITNRFDPLRAAVVGSTAVSISQRDLVTADISNPDAPKVLADLLLAWPVNRLLETAGHLLQISDGSSWYGNGPGLVITRSNDPDTVLGEVALGDGTVRDAAVSGKTLRILRQTGTKLVLDIYGLGALPTVTPLGSATNTLQGTMWDVQVGKMLSPSTNCVVSVIQPNSRCWYGWGYYPPIAIDPLPVLTIKPVTLLTTGTVSSTNATVASASSTLRLAASAVAATVSNDQVLPVSSSCFLDYRSWWSDALKTQPSSAAVFSVTNPLVPAALPSVTLTDTNAGTITVAEASGGLLVIGYGDGETPSQWKRYSYRPLVVQRDADGTASLTSTDQSSGYGLLSSAKHHLRIIDLQDPSAPVLGPVLDLPGKLLAISDLTRDGFLSWTETCGASRQLQVSACDGSVLSQISSAPVDFGAPVSASGRNLFTVSPSSKGSLVTRRTLSDAGVLQTTGSVSLNWSPSTIKSFGSTASSTLFGTEGVNIFSSVWNSGSSPTYSVWKATLWFSTESLSPLSGGGLAVPEGDYGVEVFRP